ncbi:hypothetical protein N0V85_003475 [Neurospora sp. IMI 360204]|nr:hypothetical protein N0V85_003475 [Neurospora sp. IMI 360204]
MEHSLAEYLPDDFPWEQLVTVATLKKQCAERNLSSEGTMKELQQRLVDHRLTNSWETYSGLFSMFPSRFVGKFIFFPPRSRRYAATATRCRLYFNQRALYADYDDADDSGGSNSHSGGYEEEDDSNNSIREISPDGPWSDEEPFEDEQPMNAPVQPNNQQPRSNTPGLYIKRSFSPPPRLGPRSPSILIKDESSPSPPPQQPPSSPLRRRQPSRAAKDKGLVRQSLAAAAEAPTGSPRRTPGRALGRTPASDRESRVPAQSNTPIPVPVIPAHALQQIQQHQQSQRHHDARTNSAPAALIPAAAPLVAPVEALASGSGSAAQATAQPAVAPAPQALGSDTIAAPVGSAAAVSSSPVLAPSSGTAPPRASARSGGDSKRKASRLARKLKSVAREATYVREHAERELKRLAKKSRRLEKRARALARRNEADGVE